MDWKYCGSIFIILRLLVPSPASAQIESLDSLGKTNLINVRGDEQIRMLNRMAYEFKDAEPEKSLNILDDVIKLCRESENTTELAKAYSTAGYVHNSQGRFTNALNAYLGAIKIYRALGAGEEVGILTYRIGLLYKTLGDYRKALEYCHEGLRIYEKINDKNGLALIYRVMGSIFKYQKDYEKSLFYYFEGMRLNEEIGSQQGIANSFNNIGVVYFEMMDYQKALEFYKKSLEINIRNNTLSEIAINYGNIGVVYLETSQMDSALTYFNKKHDVALALKDNRRIATSLEAYGDYYLKDKDYNKAVDYYKEALEISRELGTLETTKNILNSLSNLYDSINDKESSLFYFRSYISVRDSLLNSETLQKISKMEMEYNLEKEQSEHFLLEQKKRLFNILGFSALMLFVFFLVLVYMNQRIKLKRKTLDQKKLEMDKKQLQYEVQFKNAELTSKAMYLAERNAFIIDITSRLYKLMHNATPATRELKSIIQDLESHSNMKIWSEFEYTFLQVHPEFFNNLSTRFPELTPNEKRLSALLRLNLSTKDISNITHQTLHSLTVARTRLRKKLGISNSGENLITFLNQF